MLSNNICKCDKVNTTNNMSKINHNFPSKNIKREKMGNATCQPPPYSFFYSLRKVVINCD